MSERFGSYHRYMYTYMYMYMYIPACSCCLFGVQETNVPRETLDGGGLLPLGGAEVSGRAVSRSRTVMLAFVIIFEHKSLHKQ